MSMQAVLPSPRPPYPQIELRDLIGVSPVNRATGRRRAGQVICALRSFWFVAPGREPVRIVHTDPRKERKF
jgi:hypothetical protein